MKPSDAPLQHNKAGQLLSESFTGGSLNGLNVQHGYQAGTLRPVSVEARNGAATLVLIKFGYDAAGRFAAATNGTLRAAYFYVANCSLIDHIDHHQSGNFRMRQSRQYDRLNRLQQISTTTNGSSVSVSGSGYAYNQVNQRTRNTQADGAYWVYRYDQLGQVISGKKYWSDGTSACPVRYGNICLRVRTAQLSRSEVLCGAHARLEDAVCRASSGPSACHTKKASTGIGLL